MKERDGWCRNTPELPVSGNVGMAPVRFSCGYAYLFGFAPLCYLRSIPVLLHRPLSLFEYTTLYSTTMVHLQLTLHFPSAFCDVMDIMLH